MGVPEMTDVEGQSSGSKLSAEQKKAIRFALITLLLLLINFGYMYAGAFLFLELESTNDMEACLSAEKDFNDSRNATLQLMMDQATQLDKFSSMSDADKMKVKNNYRTMLQIFAASALSTARNASRTCAHMNADPTKDSLAWDSKWSKGNALLYALTIITTIGYGYTVPSTKWGRWATILYGLIGIPLLLACLANFGIILAKIFRTVYGGLCCCGLCRRKTKAKKEVAKVPAVEGGRQMFRTDASGKPIVNSDLAGAPEPPVVDAVAEEEGAAAEEEDEALTVPLFISLIVMAVALVTGMVIFMDWEGFGAVEAVYYTFISLSTIGFGDIVPKGSFAISGGNPTTVSRCIGTVLFIFIGMSMISMCFQLINDEISAKLEWLAEKAAAMKKKKEQQRAEAAAAAAKAAAKAAAAAAD